MEKLTIQELAAYLPWEVEVRYKDCMSDKYKKALLTGINKLDIETTYKRKINGCVGDIISFKGNNNIDDLNFKILLLPLSHLTKEIEHKGEMFVPYDKLKTVVSEEQWVLICNTISDEYKKVIDMPYWWVRQLLEWNFDIFGLIDRGLAIDKTTI